jgi:hypothetical protein
LFCQTLYQNNFNFISGAILQQPAEAKERKKTTPPVK